MQQSIPVMPSDNASHRVMLLEHRCPEAEGMERAAGAMSTSGWDALKLQTALEIGIAKGSG